MSTLEVKMDGIPGVACLFVLPMGKERCKGGVKEVGVIRERPGNRRPKTRQQNSSCPETRNFMFLVSGQDEFCCLEQMGSGH